MSSIENMVTDIENDYQALLKEFEEHLAERKKDPEGYKQWIDNGFTKISEENLLGLLRHANSFQRKIELTRDTAQRLLDKVNHSQRVSILANNVIDRLCNEKSSYETITYYYKEDYVVVGVIPLLKKAYKNFLEIENTAYCLRTCYSAYRGIKLVKSLLIELEEELKTNQRHNNLSH